MELIERFSSPDEAESGLMGMLERKEKIMGFGHAIYRESDPRNAIIKNGQKGLHRGRGYGLLSSIRSV